MARPNAHTRRRRPIRWPQPSPGPRGSSNCWPRAAVTRSVRASSPGASGCRSPRSRTSAARSPTPGLVRRIGTGFALGRRLAELGGAYLASVDQVQEFYEASRQPAGRLRGDGPVRGPRRARGHIPRAPRRSPAGPADVGDRPAAAGLLDRDRQGRPRVARPTHELDRRLDGLTTSPTGHAARRTRRSSALRADLDEIRRARLRDRRRGDHGGRRLLRRHDPEPPAAARGRAPRASRCSRCARRPSGCPP